MSVRAAVISQIETVAREKSLKLPPLADDLVLLGSGLDSLSLAILVVRLADQLGYDPFEAGLSEMPITLGDFIRMYERHAA
ncbi:MAG TPA: hypothetical protein VFB15_03375 [Candidatus Binataceae bacterium]|jgi:hypothetical protein|nr:hypothetical protein [Candidatus Binataceae bacterium]